MAGVLLAVSIAFQLGAVTLAVRLIWITRQAPAWLLISAAIALMALRRGLSLVDFVTGLGPAPDVVVESVALVISILLFLGLLGIGRLFTSMQQARADLAASERQLRDVMRTMNEGLEIVDADQRIVFVNDRMCEMSGLSHEELLGRRVTEIVDPAERETVQRHWQARRAGGSDPYEIGWRRPDGAFRHALISPCPRFDEAGNFIGSIAVVTDITNRKKAEDDLKERHDHELLLRREITHRVGNNLATLMGLVQASSAHASSVNEFAEALSRRIAAMQRVHAVLARAEWKGGHVTDVVQGALAAYAQESIDCEGPEANLTPRESTALGLVLNELATNAAKYGALRGSAGRVELRWEQLNGAGGDRLAFHWCERDGDPIDPPDREGLGTQLVRGLVESDLRGQVELSYPSEGAAHRFTITLDER